MDQDGFRRLVAGESGGLGAKFLRNFLEAASKVYSAIIGLRNFLYSKGWLKIQSANAVVISVGNITAGGTGKTPLVVWLCKFLHGRNINCAILTRGYKTKSDRLCDEPAILAKNCPEAKVVVKADRVAGAAEAVNKFGAEALIMDDGFQHRRLARDVDIVTVDATQPFGIRKRSLSPLGAIEHGKVLPAGLLREPVEGLKRAGAVVLTRCDQTSEHRLNQLVDMLRLINPNIVIGRSIHEPVCAKSRERKEIGVEELRDQKIFAFCGIGNPDAFLKTIKELGGKLVGWKIYDDHHNYTQADINDICEEARRLNVDCILTTQKDWTKTVLLASTGVVRDTNVEGKTPNEHVANGVKKNMLFAYLAIELKFLAGEDELKRLIENALAGKIPQG